MASKAIVQDVTVLGGLPVTVHLTYDVSGNGRTEPRETYIELFKITWLSGCEITQKVYDRIEKGDPGFRMLIERVINAYY